MLVKTPQVAEKDMWHQFLLTSFAVILKSFAILAIQSARAFEKSLRGCGHAAGQKRCKKMAISLLQVLQLAEIWASNLFHACEFPPGKMIFDVLRDGFGWSRNNHSLQVITSHHK